MSKPCCRRRRPTISPHRGLRGGQLVSLTEAVGLLVKPDVARRQIDAESAIPTSVGPGGPPVDPGPDGGSPVPGGGSQPGGVSPAPPEPARPTRFHGTDDLDSARVGRDAGQIADEVISHLHGLIGAEVTVTLEIQAKVPSGAPDNVVRTVTENARTLEVHEPGVREGVGANPGAAQHYWPYAWARRNFTGRCSSPYAA